VISKANLKSKACTELCQVSQIQNARVSPNVLARADRVIK